MGVTQSVQLIEQWLGFEVGTRRASPSQHGFEQEWDGGEDFESSLFTLSHFPAYCACGSSGGGSSGEVLLLLDGE